MDRPTINDGDYGSLVRLVQECLLCDVDGAFGPETEKAVIRFQDNHNLENDGIVGPATWAKLAEVYDLPPYPTPMLEPLPLVVISAIETAAIKSAAVDFDWDERGVAPVGYTMGMALAYATCVRKFENGDMTAHEMAKAETGDDEHDALALYRSQFRKIGIGNSVTGRRVLRSVFVFLLGLGMRETSGEHCCGRDQSADNTSSDTAEAGLFQTSWNYHVCATDAVTLYDEYRHALADIVGKELQCQLVAFEQGVSCSSDDWENYGSGAGEAFQELSKTCPAFAVESAAVGIRNLRKHWGPIGRMEVQITSEADDLFLAVDKILAAGEAVA